MSELFFRTLREDPADAELPSHRWLVRAGYIRRVAPGIYTWLPLGLRVLQRVEEIVREEMAAMGGQEVRFPALLPREPYEATNRWTEYGPNLFRLQDRKHGEYLLGPTHEEMFTLAVKDLVSSYKELPLVLYQIQTKYRDEARPRAGLLRGREFVMKDAYSFDLTEEGLAEAYRKHRDAYIKVFDRLGMEYVIVHADAGAMGGSASEEFLAVAENGEDTFVRSPGGYAANVEAVDRVPAALAAAEVTIKAEGGAPFAPEATDIETPGATTIATVVDALNDHAPRDDRPWQASDTLKNVVFMLVYPDGSKEPLAIGIPGDREVDPKRLEVRVQPAEAVPFSEADFAAYPDLVKGYIGPKVLGIGELGEGDEPAPGRIRYLVDPAVTHGSSWVSGADRADHHSINLVAGRDFSHDGLIDVVTLREGDPAPDGSGPLSLARGIEIGHIFQLGRKYADALGLTVLDHNGKQAPVTMGSYGLGVSRAVAAVAEGTCDEKGLAWPRALAPYDVHVLATGKGEEVLAEATRIAEELAAAGLEVLLDDRKASPGVKFADSEVLGMPTSVVVGRGLADGVVEVRDRTSGDQRNVPVADAVTEVLTEINGR
ncbi:proline--tRNA ligase [Parenemella sanctibonifatiensis]|uniref:Proline--tRNA ligase n=1 Tax=Parenemella sanctibonifatiensis TaxID=2016505 RepID=A0A255EG85_9ACTN|nr:proline--tRNA ligase [Parenemella sanctibonifatiensis]OYN88358.1 proline--tRNA ligase [Parenemella sanctibonifatiensis]OYN89961.1 proline--tRNA ligase [Parenemella sanctibonifatiensis]